MSLRLRKRKNQEDEEDEWSANQANKHNKGKECCIIHSSGMSEYGNFTNFKTYSKKDAPGKKLKDLLKIRDDRLKLPINSPYRMHKQCKSIPESLDGIDIALTGWHRECYKKFTHHIDRIKEANSPP